MKPLPPYPMPTAADHTRRYVIGTTRIGAVLATVISWSLNKSILWALIHGFCSWFYVIYYAIFL